MAGRSAANGATMQAPRNSPETAPMSQITAPFPAYLISSTDGKVSAAFTTLTLHLGLLTPFPAPAIERAHSSETG